VTHNDIGCNSVSEQRADPARHGGAAWAPADLIREVASPRVRGFGTSVFTEMSRLANQHGAVNLGQGFPDFPGPSFVKEAAKAAVNANLNQYAVSHGAPRLRAAIARTWNERYGMDVDPDREVTVTSGATEAIFDAVQALVAPGDEIVVFEPFYDSYLPSAIMAGASLRVVTLQPPDWSFDPQEAAAAFGPRTRVLLLNTPHNPTGKVFHRDELATLAVSGAYFLMSDISHLEFESDVEFCRWLTTEIGVAAVPPSAFYLDSARAPLLARFCFAKCAETIQLAAERLAKIPKRAQSGA
jgi:aspartate/methionine/tyrosine aminotransferase